MTTGMFHQGDLQSGIAAAIDQQKYVACFIYKPDDESSKQWEEEYLTANTCSGNVCGQVGSLIADKAVLLKIELGSKEAGFLNAFCPIEQAPTLVIIHNGNVLETITGEVGKDDFVERLTKAVGLGHEDGKDTAERGAEQEGSTEPNTAAEQEVLESDPLIQPETQTPSVNSIPTGNQPTNLPSHQPSPQATTLLAERARRLEADRLRREADEKAARLARRKAREEEAASTSSANKPTTTSDRNQQQQARDAWIYQQKQRKDEAKKEKQRILSQIEADKQERKAATLRRKQAEGGGGAEFSELLATSGSRGVASGVGSDSCALQIRLFDGSSIRSKFAADADLATAVRTWISEASPEGGADIPYSFRQILAPRPSRSIEVGEEGMSLRDLGLSPSATLVLVPVQGAVDAYGGSTSYMNSALNGTYWFVNTAGSFASSLLGAVPGLGGASSSGEGPYMAGTGDPQEASNARGADMAGADGGQTGTKVRVKTLADQRAEQERRGKENTEFYNGNSSAFEGDDGGKRS